MRHLSLGIKNLSSKKKKKKKGGQRSRSLQSENRRTEGQRLTLAFSSGEQKESTQLLSKTPGNSTIPKSNIL